MIINYGKPENGKDKTKPITVQLKQALFNTDQENGHWPGP